MAERLSLRDYDSVADRIRHSRQGDIRGVVIVEGPTDARLLERVANRRFAIFPAGGRGPAIDELRRARAAGVERIVAVVDRDFDSAFDEARGEGLPVCSVDASDLEAQLVVDQLLGEVLREFGSASRTTDVAVSDAVRRSVLGAGMIAALRAHGQVHGHSIAFDAIDLRSKIGKEDLGLRVRSFAQSVLRECTLSVQTAVEIVDGAAGDLQGVLDEAPLESIAFRGRDAIAFGAVSLMQRLGRLSLQQADVHLLEGSLRLLAPSSPGIARLVACIEREVEPMVA